MHGRRWFFPPRRVLIGGLAPPILLAAFLGACERRPVGSSRPEGGEAVARVDGKLLYRSEFAAMLPEDYQHALTSEELRGYLDRWIATEVLYDEAQRSNVELTGEIQAKLEQYKKDLVADLLVQQVLREKAVVTDQEVRDYYNRHVDEYTKEYRVSHILLGSMEDAEEVKELLKKRPFSWIERRHSLDRHTGPGGDLGFLSKGNMVPEFEDVVFNMKVGEVSDVIESEFGYHIIMLTDVRDSRAKLEYDDVAADISRTLLREKRAAVYDSLITSLVGRADIEVLDPQLRLVTSGDVSPDTAVVDTLAPDFPTETEE